MLFPRPFDVLAFPTDAEWDHYLHCRDRRDRLREAMMVGLHRPNEQRDWQWLQRISRTLVTAERRLSKAQQALTRVIRQVPASS